MIEIIACSSFALETLRSSRGGYIHSVYKKTVNIVCGTQLLSIQAFGTPASPLSLITNMSGEKLCELRLRRGTEINVLSGSAEIGGHILDMTHCGIWNAALNACTGDAPDAQYMEQCLASLMPTGGFADLLLPDGKLWKERMAAREAAHLLADANGYLRAGNDEAAAELLCGLIGLGEGLTPSGDDFLCGVLAAGRLCGGRAARLSEILKSKILGRLDQTNDISAAFLKCACDGLFGQAVIELQEKVGVEHSSRSFAAIGHSSGADTLSGILYAARLG